MHICTCFHKLQDEITERAFQAKIRVVESARDEELGKLKRLADLERQRLIAEETKILGFEKALQRNIGCAHTRTKAWGNEYGSGLR